MKNETQTLGALEAVNVPVGSETVVARSDTYEFGAAVAKGFVPVMSWIGLGPITYTKTKPGGERYRSEDQIEHTELQPVRFFLLARSGESQIAALSPDEFVKGVK